MIAMVWVSSMIICLPPLVGWKRPAPPANLGYPQCQLTDDIGYVLYSTLGSFYIPLVILVVVYFKIYLAARARARKGLKNKPDKSKKSAAAPIETKVNMQQGVNKDVNNITTTSFSKQNNDCGVDNQEYSSDDVTAVAEGRSPVPSPSRGSPTTDEDFRLDMKLRAQHAECDVTPAAGDSDVTEARQERATLLVPEEGGPPRDVTDTPDDSAADATPSRRRPLLGVLRSVRKTRLSTTHSPVFKHKSVYGGRDDRKVKDDPERAKRRLAKARERRATIVLGIVMATFIVCWLPFFSIYVIATLAQLDIPAIVFAIFFWAGYCNSALNPLIYTVFNQDFRQAFASLLFGRKAKRWK